MTGVTSVMGATGATGKTGATEPMTETGPIEAKGGPGSASAPRTVGRRS